MNRVSDAAPSAPRSRTLASLVGAAEALAIALEALFTIAWLVLRRTVQFVPVSLTVAYVACARLTPAVASTRLGELTLADLLPPGVFTPVAILTVGCAVLVAGFVDYGAPERAGRGA